MREKEDKYLEMTVRKVISKRYCDDIVHRNMRHSHSECIERGESYAD